MQVIYPYALIVHLFCAIFFVGFLFTDVVILKYLFNHLSQEECNKIKGILGKIETKIMPLCFFLLIITGGMMVSTYINSKVGYTQTPMQILLLIKVGLALLVLGLVVFSLSMHFLFNRPNPLAKIIHPLVFVIAIAIVLLAKLMFLV